MQLCYHENCDNLEVMLTDENLMFLDKITDTLIATIGNLSDSYTTSGKCGTDDFVLVYTMY